MAFCNYLAYYCAKDKEKWMLFLDKVVSIELNGMRGEFTYGEKTFVKLIKDCKNVLCKMMNSKFL